MRLRLALALALAGCGGGSADTPDADISGLVYAPCAPEQRVGGFEVVLAADYTGVQGQVLDGVVAATVLETVSSDGACRLAGAPQLFCDPACEAGQTCSTGEQCVPYPTAHDVGTVTVAGLAASVEMVPRAPGFFYTNPGTLPHPGFTPGAAILLAAGGGDYAPFQLRGWGVSALASSQTQVTVESGAAVALAWTPPAEAGPARVAISLNVNAHGLVGTRIECEVDDTGSFTIPEPLISTLIADGVSGFPTLTLTRSSADSTPIEPGCVDLRVRSALDLEVIIPGLTSCNGDEDCTPPQTCQADLTCG